MSAQAVRSCFPYCHHAFSSYIALPMHTRPCCHMRASAADRCCCETHINGETIVSPFGHIPYSFVSLGVVLIVSCSQM